MGKLRPAFHNILKLSDVLTWTCHSQVHHQSYISSRGIGCLCKSGAGGWVRPTKTNNLDFKIQVLNAKLQIMRVLSQIM
jgi:hypothetical protein